jgi:hypothetical protein
LLILRLENRNDHSRDAGVQETRVSIASQEMTLVIAGRKPERPCRMNCTMPLSGLRKPCSSSPAANPDDQHPHKRSFGGYGHPT